MKTLVLLTLLVTGLLFIAFAKRRNDYVIDSKRMGDIKLGDKMKTLFEKYKDIDTLYFLGENGIRWKGYRINYIDASWLIVESSASDSSSIQRISTNSSVYTTINGYKVGDKISKIEQNLDKIDYLDREDGFKLLSDKLSFGFHIEEKYMDNFYYNLNGCNHCLKSINYMNSEATIQEITLPAGCDN